MNNNVQPLYGAPAPERLRSIEIIEPDTTKIEKVIYDLNCFEAAVKEQEMLFRGEIKLLLKSNIEIEKENEKRDKQIKYLKEKYNALFAFTTVLGTLFSIIIAGLVFYVK